MLDRSLFTLDTIHDGSSAVVTLSGELDSTGAPALKIALAALGETAPGSLALDMAGVTYISAAAAAVIAAAARSRPALGQLAVRDPSPIVLRMFQLTGLASAVQLDLDAPPDDELGPRDLAVLLATPVAGLRQARELGLLPQPGPGGRWSPEAVAEIVSGWPRIAAAVEAAQELGAVRGAELLARVTGLPVATVHIDELAARGVLTSSRSFKNRPLYRVADLRALASDPASLDLLTQITSGPAGPTGCPGR